MKKTKVIIPALGILLLSTAASVTGTVAWFSANSTVTATGMKVNAKAESALVIGHALPVGTETTYNFNEQSPATLVPATHKASVTGDVTFASETGLQYNSNPANIDAATGYGADGAGVSLADVAVANVGTYSVDYFVYIASAGKAKTLADGEKLTARLGVDSTTYTNLGQTAYDTLNALSVDFYVCTSDAAGTFAGTLNLKQGNLSNSSYESSTPISLMTSGTIPVNNQSSSFLKIVMRVYFDGNLQKTAQVGQPGDDNYAPAQAYVYSDIINTSDIQFSAKFMIE